MPKEAGIGIEVGATNLKVVIGTQKGKIFQKKTQRTLRTGISGDKVTQQVISLIHKVKKSHYEIEGIGIGSIGPLDIFQGIVKNAPNVPFQKIQLKKPLEKEFNVPVSVINDCAAAALGEKYFGAAKRKENFAYVTLSSGIGGGIFVDGRLLLGKNGNATEIGHLVIDPKGLKCGCGKRGHWEAYCGGNNIPRYVKRLVQKHMISREILLENGRYRLNEIDTKLLYQLAKKENKASLKVVKKIGKINAIGFANIVNCFAPSLITVGGGIALNNPQLVLHPIKQYIKEFTIQAPPPIKITPLKENVVLYGALWIAFNQISSLYGNT